MSDYNDYEDSYEYRDGEAYARHNDPGTSHDAADSIEGENATRLENIVLSYLRGNKSGYTAHELSDISHIPYQTLTPRLAPLRRKGWIKDSGIRRPSKHKRNNIVWQATDQQEATPTEKRKPTFVRFARLGPLATLVRACQAGQPTEEQVVAAAAICGELGLLDD